MYHELNQSMQAISSYLELLTMDEMESKGPMPPTTRCFLTFSPLQGRARTNRLILFFELRIGTRDVQVGGTL